MTEEGKKLHEEVKDLCFIVVVLFLLLCGAVYFLMQQREEIEYTKQYCETLYKVSKEQTKKIEALEETVQSYKDEIGLYESRADTIVDCILKGKW